MEIIRITIDELLERYAAGERNFTQFQIRYTHTYTVRGNIIVPRIIDLKGVNLSGATFGTRAFESINPLDGINLSQANLSGAWLDEHSINKANLRGANFFQSSLRGTNLRDANFRGASLMHTILWNAKVDGADFRGANLNNASWHGTRLTNVKFKGAIDSSFRGAIFDNTIMPDGTIRNSH